MVRTELGEVLRIRKDELVQAWAERSKRSSERYGERPLEEVKRNLGALLDAMVELADTDDRTAVEAVVQKVYPARARAGFSFEDTLTVLFVGIEEGIRALKMECDARGCSSDFFQLANELIDVFSEVTVLHAQTLEDMRRKDLVADTVSGLAKAYEGLDEESILQNSMDGLRDRFNLDDEIHMLCEEESFPSRCDDSRVEALLRAACERAIHTGQSVTLESSPAEDASTAGAVDGKPRTAIGIPITARGGMLGSIAVASRTKASLSDNDRRMVEAVAGHIGVACENTRIYRGASNAVEKLTAGKSELFTILSGLEAAVYVADMETYEILAVNRVIEDIYGPNLVGRKCYEALQRGQTEPCTFCTNDKLMENGESTGPYIWRFKDTLTGRWYNCIDKAVMWPNGRHVRLELAFDITDAEAARTETENARDLLELYNDILLHDLGNHAGTIIGYLDLAIDTPEFGEKERSFVASAREQAEKCGQLIDRVSQFSKVLTAKDEARHGRSLNSILDEAIEEAIGIHSDQKPVIRKEYSDEGHIVPLGVFAKDVFLNLLTNAIKYGDGKVVAVRIDEDHLDERPAWKVSIMDNGQGISEKDKKKLFQRYSRLDTPKHQKGMGLGLSIARTVTDRYGGEIRVEDRVPGDHMKGACFIVVFPKA